MAIFLDTSKLYEIEKYYIVPVLILKKLAL